jgi:hypothetical protein
MHQIKIVEKKVGHGGTYLSVIPDTWKGRDYGLRLALGKKQDPL